MSSHLRQSPDSPAIHPGISLHKNPSQAQLVSLSLRGAADAQASRRQGRCSQGARAIPASCTGLLRWGSSPSSLSHCPRLLSLPKDPLVFLIPLLSAGFMGSLPAIALSNPWCTYSCSLLLQGKLGRKQNHGHTANKIPPWAKETVVWSPRLWELIRSCLVAAVTRVLGATQISTPASSPLSKAGAVARQSGFPNQAAPSGQQAQTPFSTHMH